VRASPITLSTSHHDSLSWPAGLLDLYAAPFFERGDTDCGKPDMD